MGAAAGVCFALDAVFLRGLTAALSPVVLSILVLNLAGFAVASVLGNLVIQRAFQMAPLRHVLPAMAAAEPVTAFLCARYVFGERLSGGVSGAIGVGGGLLLMVCGVVLCAVGRPVPPAPALAPAVPAVADARESGEGRVPAAVGSRSDPAHRADADCDDSDDEDCIPPPVLGLGLPYPSKRAT
jgi:hypothetical protein